MRRSRTEGSKRRRCVATALAFGIVALALGCAGRGRAETQLAPFESFSSAKLQRVGDLIRQEIAAGKMPGAIILIQQHGHPVYFECFGVADRETAAGRAAGNAVGLWPFDRCARPRHRGYIRPDAL